MVYLIFLVSGCARPVKADLSKPEGVVDQFIKGQAEGNNKLVDALLSTEMKKKFSSNKKLYLSERTKLQSPGLESREYEKTYDTPAMQVYELRYYIKAKNRERSLRMHEAVSVIKQGENWLIGDYSPDNQV